MSVEEQEREEFSSTSNLANASHGGVIGLDVGATLAKLCARDAAGELCFGFLPSSELEALAQEVGQLEPPLVGLTGCGALGTEPTLGRPAARVLEFTAWGRGSTLLLESEGLFADREPYVLVSVGTGTSALRVEAGQVERLGGSALGGGTILGLGTALTGCESFAELAELANRGSRGGVDLLIGDLYQEGEIAIPAQATAASFGKLARWLAPQGSPHRPEDSHETTNRSYLAAAVMGLVGENVALIASGLASAAGIEAVVFGGSTLRENPSLALIMAGVTGAMGHRPLLLPNGGYAGAVGALLEAEAAAAA